MVRGGARWVVAVGLASGALIRQHTEVDACSLFPFSIDGRTSYPADGAIDVPTNTRIRVSYAAPWSVSASLILREEGGDEVAAQIGSVGGDFELRPLEPLRAGTRYEVLDDLVVPCEPQFDEDESVCYTTPTVFARFEVGVGPDTAPPGFAGLASLTTGYHFVEEGCDGETYGVVNYHLAWSAASDDGPADGVVYDVYAGEDRVVRLRGSSANGRTYCGEDPYVDPESVPDFYGGPGLYSVKAVDGAGNEDDNDVEREALDCEAAEDGADAGPDEPDGGAAGRDSDAGGDADGTGDGGSGCRAGGAARGSSAAALVWAAIASARLRRRTRSRS